nr:hypothetical protein NG677_04460 [Methylobacterium sp. OTU13CASTA1]
MADYFIPELAGLDPSAAAGILARAALAMESFDENPDALPIRDDELILRAKIIDRISSHLVDNFHTQQTNLHEEVIDWLDEAANLISEPEDDKAALRRLSVNAALPSDAYVVSFDSGVQEVESRSGLEDRNAVRECIKKAQFSEEFNPNSGPNKPEFVSIFGQMVGESTDRNRYMLIAVAERNGINLDVKHYWRVFNTDVPLYPARSLTGLLHSFADIYGIDFTLNGWRGRFLIFEKFPEKTNRINVVNVGNGENGDVSVGCIVARIYNGFYEAAIGININVTKYRRRLRRSIAG